MNWLKVNILALISILLSLLTCEEPKLPKESAQPSEKLAHPEEWNWGYEWVEEEKRSAVNLYVHTKEGSIAHKSYAEWSLQNVAIFLSDSGDPEPIVLFFGVEDENGLYIRSDFLAVVSVVLRPGGALISSESAWYLLVSDPKKELLGASYKIKFIQ